MNNSVATIYNPELRIWSGRKQKDLYGADMTLGEVALLVLSRQPEKIVQVMDSTGDQLTGAQLIRNGKVIAHNLQKIGLKVGDVIGLYAANHIYIPSLVLGGLLCGTPINALYHLYDKKMIRLILDMSRPRIIFCDEESYPKLKAVLDENKLNVELFSIQGHIAGVRHIEELLIYDDAVNLQYMEFPCAQLNGDSTAIILCSSGTTGTPKGVNCSHRLLTNRPVFSFLPSDAVIFTFSSLHWASGWMFLLTSLIHGNKQIITNAEYTPEMFADIVERHRITHMMIATAQLILLMKNINSVDLKKSFSHMDIILCGGSKVPKIVTQKLNATLVNVLGTNGAAVGYGMSELMYVSRNDGEVRQDDSEGKLVPNTEIRVVGDDGQLLGPNEEGILHIRTPYKWAGYYRNPEATKKARADNDWIISGDIGFFDAEGFVHIRSRDNDVFKSNRFIIYPTVIEDVLLQLLGVLEVCVFGVPNPLAVNHIACAVVRTQNGHGRALTSQQIENHFRENLSAIYKLEGGVYFMDALPKTSSGKIQRNKVLELVQGNTTASGSIFDEFKTVGLQAIV